jgi:small-conductance mechanosensitive channel
MNANHIRASAVLGIALPLWLGVIGVAWGQASLKRVLVSESRTSSAATNSETATQTVAALVKALEEKLSNARADLTAAISLENLNPTNRPAGISLQEIALRRGLLERLVRLYEQQISYTAELETAKSRRAELAREAESWTGFSEARPYSILLTDGLHEGVQIERLEIANGKSALVILGKLIDEQKALLSQAEEKIRQLDEQLESKQSATAGNRLNWPRELERLRSQTAAATVGVLDLERQIRQERLAGSRVRLALLQRQLAIAVPGATLTDTDLVAVNARLDTQLQELERELAEARTRQSSAAEALDRARQELRRVQPGPDAVSPSAARPSEQFELRRAQLEAANTRVNSLRFMLQAATLERTIWEVRYAAYKTPDVETLRQSRSRLEEFIGRVELWKTYYRQELESAASQVERLEMRLAGPDSSSELAPLLRERLAALRERDEMLLRVVRTIERGERQIRRLHEEMQEAAGNLPLMGRVRNTFSDTRSFLAGLWNLELFVAQDTITVDGQPITGKRSITLGKIIKAILILVVGYWLAELLSRFMEPIFIKRFKIEPNQANLIRRWLRVVFIVSLAVFSLVSVKIPLTVFAFAGGALAIGLGFGLQTLLKNFVSGIIILFERPFRVGDVLDVAGQRGTVAIIGIRSSVLQLWDGTETLIPNSTLLENNLTNWTYSSRKVRFTVTVGVAYGSDTRRVVQLLTEIADRHGLVEKEPKPQVFFTNFGESTLDFELRFWADVLKANSSQVASDLRQMIAGTFAEHGIVIAFPQRDLNLSAIRPLSVQIMPVVDRPADSDAAKQAAPANPARPVQADNGVNTQAPAVKLP